MKRELHGFRKVGAGYERAGFGGRTWYLHRAHNGWAIELQPLAGDLSTPNLVEDWARSLDMAIHLTHAHDTLLMRGEPIARVAPESSGGASR